MGDTSFFVIGVILLLLGGGVGYGMHFFLARRFASASRVNAKDVVDRAHKKCEELVLDAKNKAVSILEDAKSEEKSRLEQIRRTEERLERREEGLEQRGEEFDRGRKALEKKAEEIRAIRSETEALHKTELARLEKIAGLTSEQAKDILLQLVEDDQKKVLSDRLERLEREGMEGLEKRAQKLMTDVIQKYARSHAADVMTTAVTIGSEEVKGRIIGKEGRNIRSLERLTGVEVIVDDTPDSIIVSGFDPIRREVAKIALEKLLEDGRIHPGRIEEAVAGAEKEIDRRIREAGEAAAYEANVTGLNPKLLYILGRLRYRTSYKQNQLLHSLEVSYLSGALAAELGMDVKVARMAGLLHDIGKAVDHEVQGTHVNIGVKILQKFNVPEKVILAMRSHHEEYPYATPEAFVVTAADAISASRPGARKETVEKYLKRLEELEALTLSFEGVEKCYAINAGREIRVFVTPEKLDDWGALKLAKDLAKKIEDMMGYPGEIKVNVVRETRAVEYAR
ncbi:MAG: ribonuclease Y [Candidatus Moranbacteria bacterium]|nr:ribonuclease Y [Candidatus Moranbacteria bacterium]